MFNSAKKLFIAERDRLTEDIIEACECLKGWEKKDLTKQRED